MSSYPFELRRRRRRQRPSPGGVVDTDHIQPREQRHAADGNLLAGEPVLAHRPMLGEPVWPWLAVQRHAQRERPIVAVAVVGVVNVPDRGLVPPVPRLVAAVPDMGVAGDAAEQARPLGDLPREDAPPRRVLDEWIPPIRSRTAGTPGAVPRHHLVGPPHRPEIARGVTDVLDAGEHPPVRGRYRTRPAGPPAAGTRSPAPDRMNPSAASPSGVAPHAGRTRRHTDRHGEVARAGEQDCRELFAHPPIAPPPDGNENTEAPDLASVPPFTGTSSGSHTGGLSTSSRPCWHSGDQQA
jgi:hypothetical protein